LTNEIVGAISLGMETLSYRAVHLRDSVDGLSLRETDHLAGKTAGHWQAIVSGVVENPTLETLRAYARVFGCTVGWLASGEGDPPSDEAIRAAVAAARAQRDPTSDPRPSSTPPSPAASKAA